MSSYSTSGHLISLLRREAEANEALERANAAARLVEVDREQAIKAYFAAKEAVQEEMQTLAAQVRQDLGYV